MKVNFGATFKELARYVDSRGVSARQSTGADFSRLIGSLSPEADVLDGIETKQVLPPEPQIQLSAQEPGVPMASFRFSAPKPQMALIPRLNGPEEIPETVKTPSLLEVRRLAVKSVSLSENEPAAPIKQLIHAAGSEHGVDPFLSLAVASAESGFDSNAVSRDGFASKGVFQLLDSTAATILKRIDKNAESYRPFDPQQNIDLGVRYLRYLHDVFSTKSELPNELNTTPAANSAALEKLAVAAFNAGEGRVAAAQRQAQRAGKDPGQYEDVETYLPESTREYVLKVMSAKSRFANFVQS